MEELIDQFTQITGATNEEARHFVEAAGSDVSAAIELYFQSGGGSDASGAGTSSSNGNGVHHNNGVSGSASSPNIITADDDDSVRAPIKPTSGVLMPNTFGQQYAPTHRRAPTNSVFDRMRDFKAESAAQFSRAASGLAPSDGRAGRPGGQSQSSTPDHSNSLAALFRPPVDLLTPGSWEDVRKLGSQRNLWLLVNVQNVEEFQSQVLNRDVWSHETVKGIIRGSFLFWQVYGDSEHGRRFNAYYHVASHPHVSVIDPRTGEQVLTVSVGDAVSCADALTTFLSLYPSPNDTQNVVPVAKSVPSIKRNDSDVVMDDAAVGATSSNDYGNGNTSNHNQSVASTSSSSTSNNSRKRSRNAASRDVADNEEQAACSTAKSLRPDVQDEPSLSAATSQCAHAQSLLPATNYDDADCVTLMIRQPDGKRVELKCSFDSSIQSVLAYLCVKLSCCSHTDCDFVLTYPRRVLNEFDPTTTLRHIKLNKKEMLHVDRHTKNKI